MTQVPMGSTRAVSEQRVLVVGGGITGLVAALGLRRAGVGEVVLVEADARLGGKIRTSAFAGVPAVDEGPDAFLTRGGEVQAFAASVGVTEMVAPAAASAAIWYPRRGRSHLHPIPGGLVLGVPAALRPMATSTLLSWRGKARAALEPFLPRTPLSPDALGGYMRARLGSEVHERLIDALIGSIYASDTDHSSLAAVPQVAALATAHRSLLIAARRMRAQMPPPSGAPIFSAPLAGMHSLTDAAERALVHEGGTVRTGHRVDEITAGSAGWLVDGEAFDQVVLASPAAASASLLQTAAPEAAALLAQSRHASVTMVTMAVPGALWPARLAQMSGYLVPKPVQSSVTAASFGSQKWAQWRTADDQQILRVSLGRDGLDLDHLDDEALVARAVAEVSSHIGVDLTPTAVRVTRWAGAFPQYRPRHHEWVEAAERVLPAGIHLAGASYRGIGIPTCVRDAHRAIARVLAEPTSTS